MERPTFQPRPNFNSPLSLRTLQSESVQLDTGRLPPVIPYRRADGTTRLTDTSIPPYSPISERSGSSFSQESTTTEWWENASFRFSPPHTPRAKHEFDDIPRLDLVVSHRGEFLKRKSDDLDESLKKIKLQQVTLPSVYHLLPPEEREGRRPVPRHRPRRMLQTPNSSPEPETKYSLPSQPALLEARDPIVQWLNLRRRESSDSQEPLSQPRDSRGVSLSISLKFCHSAQNAQPIFYREKQQYTSQSSSRGSCQRPRVSDQQQQQQQQQPPAASAGEESKEVGAKKVHNNTKYTTEEADFIRFNKYERKLSWEENKRLFNEKFPSPPDKEREVQGIQGVHYRDNQHVPCLTDRGRRLVFLPQGHVKAVVAQVRQQKENKPYFSLTYLYPERAMLYDWVPYKMRLKAAELANERAIQKEQERNKAIKAGKWKEKLENGQCACCYKPDGKKEMQRGSSSREHSFASDDDDDSDDDTKTKTNSTQAQVVAMPPGNSHQYHPLQIPQIIKTEDGVYGNTSFGPSQHHHHHYHQQQQQ
ncbi:uncharacterized protein F4812DRAFT_466863 [Daldinia caldariorum]|uniref:uncharacterized protein n=1 Tax=Daldinia caldariorum TaxID=326644 RepID=UPI0020087CAE|nr:uncharacterized protein F4812DRAFT_466863 [Daldinia caldariorum]KAI1464955.1 hypothetical protein F4812DRAFT_466863 [Daldinia caldariorum]